MGGRFSKAKTNSKEILEELEKQIGELTLKRRRSVQVEKSFIGYLIILSFIIYLIGLFLFYKYYFPSSGVEWLLYCTPLVLFPLVVYLVKKLLNIYFTNRKSQYDLKLQTLHEEKRRVINEVMEKEPYRVARELLERFDPNSPQLQNPPATPGPRQQQQRRATNQTPAPGTEVRQRRQGQTPHPAMMHRPVPMATPQPRSQSVPTAMATSAPGASTNQNRPSQQTNETGGVATSQQFIPPGMCLGAAPGPPTPCPILPRDRTNMDKMVEYLVGDGPNNRYALICSQCHSHNGMALRDEFEYTTFRCAYCFHLNPARKKKPILEQTDGADSTHENGASNQTQQATTATGGAGVPVDTTPTSSRPPGRRRHSSKTSERSKSLSSEDGKEGNDDK